ncbi:MAG: serine hydrolase [Planctomycetota bacterium]
MAVPATGPASGSATLPADAPGHIADTQEASADGEALRDPLRTVAGYAAKVTASAVFVGGRDLASVRAGELFPVRPLERMSLPMIQLEVDREARTVTASLPTGQSATAVHRDGLGCALAIGATRDEIRAQALPAPTREAPGIDVEPLDDSVTVDREAVSAALDRAFADGAIDAFVPTRAVVVLYRGRLLAERYGDGFDASSRHAGWSMAKTITGALVLLRASSGALDLEAPAPVSEWGGEDDPRRAITPLDLLRMSSGLAFDEDYGDLTSDATTMLFASNDVGRTGRTSPLAHAPGTRWSYSSGTSNVLQSILKGTFETDAAYHAFPREALFGPAGLASAVLEADASGTFVGSSFCWMTARDWARFGQLLLDDGVVHPPGTDGPRRVLPEGAVARMGAPAPASRARRHGAHLWLNLGFEDDPGRREFPTLPTDLVYLSGYEGQYVMAVPSADLVVARLGVSKSSPRASVERMVRAVLDALPSD